MRTEWRAEWIRLLEAAQRWRDGVAGDKLARGPADKEGNRLNSKGNRRPDDWLGYLEVGARR